MDKPLPTAPPDAGPPPAPAPPAAMRPAALRPIVEALRERLGRRSVVLVGLMGAGKSTIGRRLAAMTGLPFRDADAEIEAAAGMPVSDIFATFGEPAFRDGERRVIGRLLGQDPIVLATGGGAYMNAETRARIAETAISVWLRADHETLLRRVMRRSNRPLLKAGDPAETMRRLMAERYPVYALADVAVESRDAAHRVIAIEVAEAVSAKLAEGEPAP